SSSLLPTSTANPSTSSVRYGRPLLLTRRRAARSRDPRSSQRTVLRLGLGSVDGEAAAAAPLHHLASHDGLELVRRLGDLLLARRAVRLELVALLEVAERLPEIAAEPRRDREVIEALALLALPPERHADQALRLVEVGIDRDRALELLQRAGIVLCIG